MQSTPPFVPNTLSASVIVRSKDKEATIERTLRVLRAQTVPAHIVVVDSGSRDRTVEIARSYGADVVEIPASAFSYGRALNIGARQATGDILFALSAHSAPETERWLEWAMEAYRDPAVAAAIGDPLGPHGSSVTAPTTVFAADLDLDRHVTWGMSNHASSWRRRVWDEFPFNEDLIACEDKEWMWRVLGAGFAVVVDPRLYVDSQHRRGDGVKALYRRTFKEYAALAALVDFDPPDPARVLRQWWSEFPYPSQRPMWQRRLSPMRNAELVGEFFGSRAGAGRRGPQTLAHGGWNQVLRSTIK